MHACMQLYLILKLLHNTEYVAGSFALCTDFVFSKIAICKKSAANKINKSSKVIITIAKNQQQTKLQSY